MRIVVRFQFNHESEPAAESGVEDGVTDFILPAVGDEVEHTDTGRLLRGKVTKRTFRYELPVGQDVEGQILVTLCLDPAALQ